MRRTVLRPVMGMRAALGHVAWWLGYRTHPPGEPGATRLGGGSDARPPARVTRVPAAAEDGSGPSER